MKIIKRAFLFYCLALALFLTLTASFPIQIVFLPSVFFLTSTGLGAKAGLLRFFKSKLFAYFNFIVVSLVVITGFIGIKNQADLISALIFAPLALYFTIKILPGRKNPLILPEIIPRTAPVLAKKAPIQKPKPEKLLEESIAPDFDPDFDDVKKQQDFDKNRRVFIKLIGSAGLSVFVFSLFTKKAHAAFFGSVPGPGTVALKDTAGTPIDPAQNQPTDGYKISEVDDSSPAYYGFTNKDGAWFVMKENAGVYRYTKGSSGFSTNWTSRASLTYDYYHNVF